MKFPKYLFTIIFIFIYFSSFTLTALANSNYTSINSYNFETQDTNTSNISDDVLIPESFITSERFEKQISSRAIIGSNDLVEITKNTKSPYKYIGLLAVVYAGNELKTGTGFLVDDSLVLTTASNVYDGREPKSIMFYPAIKDGECPYGEATVKVSHVPTKYKQTKSDKYNYALLELDKSFGKTIGHFQKTIVLIPMEGNVLSGSIIGYDYPATIKAYKGTGDMICRDDGYFLDYGIDTPKSQSGGPIYDHDGTQYYVFGIHIGEYNYDNYNMANYGIRINNTIVNLINKYK